MDSLSAYIVATLVVLLLLVAAAYAWYNNPSKWVSFSYGGGDTVTFDTRGPQINRLRFKDCVFKTANPAGAVQQWDVTAVLNGMSTAYNVPTKKVITTLTLGGGKGIPLNPFSFKKDGFNTTADVPTAADSQKWSVVPKSATSLTGKMRIV